MAQCTSPGQRTARPGGVRLGYAGLGRSEDSQTVPERASEKFAPFPWKTKTALIYFPHSDLEGKAVEENDRGDAYMDHVRVVYYYMILISCIFTSCIFSICITCSFTHSKSIVCIRVHSWFVTFYGL